MSERNHYWDNLRFMLIVLVVVGHFVRTVRAESYSVFVLVDFIYVFHMPAFLFISGVFAKKVYSKKTGLNINTIAFYLVLYVLFHVALYVWSLFLGNKPTFSLVSNPAVPWYFLTLAMLCLSLPIIENIRGGWKVVVPCAVVLALLVGFDENFGTFLSMGRTFTFAPFFFAGYFLSIQGYSDFVANIRKKVWPIVLATIFLVSVFILLFFSSEEFLDALYSTSLGRVPYTGIKVYSDAVCAGIKIIWFFLAAAMIFAVSVLIPTGKTWISDLGTRTLQVYLLHPFVYYTFAPLGLKKAVFIPNLPWSAFGLIIGGALVATLLAWPKWPNNLLRKFQTLINVNKPKEKQ